MRLLIVLFYLLWYVKLSLGCDDSHATIYYASAGYGISSVIIQAASDNQYPKQILTGRRPISMTYEYATKCLLFVDSLYLHQIYSYNTQTGDLTFFENNAERFNEVASDPLTNNVYYINPDNAIGVCDMKKTKCVHLVESPKEDIRRHHLILHPSRGQMFWIEDEGSPNTLSSSIKQASMNGRNIRTLDSFGIVYAITLDTKNDQLYLAETSTVAQIDLTSRLRVNSAIVRVNTSTLFYANCRFYYVNRKNGQFCTYSQVLFTQHISNFNTHVLVTSDLLEAIVPASEKPCKLMECDSICVMRESKYGLKAECMESLSQLQWFGIFAGVSLVSIVLTAALNYVFSKYPCKWLDCVFGKKKVKVDEEESISYVKSVTSLKI